MTELEHPDSALPAHLMLGERGLDERTRPVKRYKALARAYAHDLGGNPSTAQRALLSRAAGLQVLAELQEVAMAEGGEVDVAAYVKLTNGLVTVLRTIGLARSIKDVSAGVGTVEGHAAVIESLAQEEGA